MNYPVWLAGLAVLFFALERIWPNRRVERKGWLTDGIHIVVNSHVWGVAVALSIGRWLPDWSTHWAGAWPVAVQIPALLFAQDFAQW